MEEVFDLFPMGAHSTCSPQCGIEWNRQNVGRAVLESHGYQYTMYPKIVVLIFCEHERGLGAPRSIDIEQTKAVVAKHGA